MILICQTNLALGLFIIYACKHGIKFDHGIYFIYLFGN